MRRLLLCSLVLTAASALAQNTQPVTGPSTDAADTRQGHPLNPYDVYVLTGKKAEAERRQQYSPSMQMYYGVPTDTLQPSELGSSQWDGAGPQMFGGSGFSGANTSYGPYGAPTPFGSQFNGSQFADVTTLSRSGFGFFNRFGFFNSRTTGVRPRWFFGNGTPAFNLNPRRSGGGFQGLTAPVISPGPRP